MSNQQPTHFIIIIYIKGEYRSMTKLLVGRTFTSNNYGDFKVIRNMKCAYGTPDELKRKYYEIEFINTGYKSYVPYHTISDRSTRDFYVPKIANVGFIGDLPYGAMITDKEYLPYYKAWNDMMHRCYNPTDRDYPLYGALGISVEERWYNFSVFWEDVKHIPNYDMKVQYLDLYQLDKDYLQRKIPKNKRVYSRNTCMWLSKIDNMFMMGMDNNKFGYCGVVCYKNRYYAQYHSNFIGQFSIPEAAANLINYLHLATHDNKHIHVLNDVEVIPFDDLEKYFIGTKSNYKDKYFELVQRLS